MENLPAIPSQAVVSEMFKEFVPKKDKIIGLLSKVRVGDDSTLAIAEDRVRDAADLVKKIKEFTDEKKKPYYSAYKHIMDYSKIFFEEIETQVKIAKSDIHKYKSIQAAQKRAEQEKAEREAQEKLKEKHEKIELLNRITDQMLARIYGGKYTNSSSESFSVPGCTSLSDIAVMQDAFRNNFPPQDNFKDVISTYSETFNLINHELGWAKKTIEKMDSKDAEVRGKAEKEFDDRKYWIKDRYKDILTKGEKKAEKETMKEAKTAENEAKEYSKGIRNVLVFEVTDFSIVHDIFKMIDETELRKYMSENRDKIRKMVEENKGSEVLRGIEFKYRQDLTIR